MSLLSELQAANNPISPVLSPNRNIPKYKALLADWPLTVKEMAEKLHESFPAVSVAIWRLKRKGLIAPLPEKRDLGHGKRTVLYTWIGD
jgi:predicted transcriptional regulator